MHSEVWFRKSVQNYIWLSFSLTGVLVGLNNSYYRLAGLTYNGLEWKRKERKLRKYNFDRISK
jgi:hypothetical protein